MVGIDGLGGIQGSRTERSEQPRERERTAASGGSEPTDNLIISNEAQAVATVAAKTLQAVAGQADIRADRVAAARAAIERGDYQGRNVAGVVADRISKLL